jgi:hypothetical protein
MNGPKRLSVRAGKHIARNTFRTLRHSRSISFQTTIGGGTGVPSPKRDAPWKTGEFNLTHVTNWYECLDCGGRHELPPRDGHSLVCPHLPDDEARKRAIGFVELKLAMAKGNYQKDTYLILDKLSIDIAWWAREYPSWDGQILSECLRNPVLNPYLTRDDTPLPDHGHNRPLSENAGEFIYKHLPLVRRLAKALGSRSMTPSTAIWRRLGFGLWKMRLNTLKDKYPRLLPFCHGFRALFVPKIECPSLNASRFADRFVVAATRCKFGPEVCNGIKRNPRHRLCGDGCSSSAVP